MANRRGCSVLRHQPVAAAAALSEPRQPRFPALSLKARWMESSTLSRRQMESCFGNSIPLSNSTRLTKSRRTAAPSHRAARLPSAACSSWALVTRSATALPAEMSYSPLGSNRGSPKWKTRIDHWYASINNDAQDGDEEIFHYLHKERDKEGISW